MKLFARLLAFALAVALAGGAIADEAIVPAYFDPDAAASVAPLIVLRQAPPPRDNAVDHTTYAWGPITGSWLRNTMAMNASTWTSSRPGEEMWVTFWAYHANRDPQGRPLKPNRVFPPIKDADGERVWVEYSSVAKANAVTTAEILFTLGASQAAWQAPLKAAGVSLLDWEAAAASPDVHFPRRSADGTGPVATDVFLIPPRRTIARRAYAVSLDYEPHDGRPEEGPQGARAFLNRTADTIHALGKKAYLYTNPWDGPLMGLNGISPRLADDIITRWDYVSSLVFEGARSGSVKSEYEYGRRFFDLARRPDLAGKIIVTFVLSNTDGSACLMHARQARDHFAGYMFFPDSVPEGGADPGLPANRRIAELLFGRGCR